MNAVKERYGEERLYFATQKTLGGWYLVELIHIDEKLCKKKLAKGFHEDLDRAEEIAWNEAAQQFDFEAATEQENIAYVRRYYHTAEIKYYKPRGGPDPRHTASVVVDRHAIGSASVGLKDPDFEILAEKAWASAARYTRRHNSIPMVKSAS